MAKKNPILAAYEAKLEAKYRKKLDITMQMCFDVACITANDVFHMGPGRAELPEGLTPEDYMAICFSMIHRADAAAFLPDWAESRGASLEHEYCRYIGKPVWYLREEKRGGNTE